MKYALVYNYGGIGDFICWTPGLRHAIERNPHISGLIVTPPSFAELAQLWLRDLSYRFKIHISPAWHEDEALIGYRIIVPTEAQFANINTMNSFELGFLYYAGTRQIPPIKRLPFISGNEVPFVRPAGKYVVITPQATVASRSFPEAKIKELSAGLEKRGYEVLPLGKDLNCTSLTEAACIMANASGVFGLDNGLLHLAQCSRVPVFTLFTTIEPHLRWSPRQPGARSFAFHVDPKKLDCLFCNSKMRFVDYDFRSCPREHYSCAESFNVEVMLKKFDEVCAQP